MLTLDSVLRPCSDKIVARVVDGEAIMINLASGVYYSMGNAGALIWELIDAGHTLKAVAAALVASYAASQQQAEADVLSLAGKLVEEELVRVSEEEFSPPTAPSATGDKRLYQTPALDVYRDIGHLVALDPPMPGLKDLPWKGPTDR